MSKTKPEEIHKLSNEQVIDLFETAFKAQADDINNPIKIDELEVRIERPDLKNDPVAYVTVTGFADTTTLSEFHNKKSNKVIDGGEKVAVTLPSGKQALFKLSDSYVLNTNDYVLVYAFSRHG